MASASNDPTKVDMPLKKDTKATQTMLCRTVKETKDEMLFSAKESTRLEAKHTDIDRKQFNVDKSADCDTI